MYQQGRKALRAATGVVELCLRKYSAHSFEISLYLYHSHITPYHSITPYQLHLRNRFLESKCAYLGTDAGSAMPVYGRLRQPSALRASRASLGASHGKMSSAAGRAV